MLPEERQTPKVELPSPEAEFVSYLGRQVGDYKIVALLGVGGMGAVFRARHRILGRDVALKVLQRSHLSRKAAVERFLFEARAASQIRCENIVQVLDFKTESEIGPYLVMELLDRGISLEKEIQRGPLPESRAIAIALQIATALDAAHTHGIVHRDLKPENIFLTQTRDRSEVVKIIDFGIAKNLAFDDELAPQRTAAGIILGTPHYMSPEQCRNIGVDHRTDIYAFGVVLFEMLTGRSVFEGANMGEIMAKHLTEEPPSPRAFAPQVSPFLEEVVLRCLAKDKEQRYDSAARLAADLSLAHKHQTTERPAPKPVRPKNDPQKKNSLLTTLPEHTPLWIPPQPPKDEEKPPPRWRKRVLLAFVFFLVAGLASFGGFFVPSLLLPRTSPPQSAIAEELAPSVSPLPDATEDTSQTPTQQDLSSAPASAPGTVPASAPGVVPTSEPASVPASAPTSEPASESASPQRPPAEAKSSPKRKKRPVQVAKKESQKKKFNIHLDE